MRTKVLAMVGASLFYRLFYKRIKEKMWRVSGVKLFEERSAFVVDLLNELKKDLKIFNSVRTASHYLLDIGCGKGDLTEKVSETYNLKAVGVDLDKRSSLNSKKTFLVADGCSLPFKPKFFILVVSFSLIEHIFEDRRQKFYEEVSKVLIDDGIFIMQLPNRYFPVEQHTFIPFFGYFPSRLHSTFYHDYVNVPSKDKTVDELIKGGFEIVRIVEYGVPFSSFFRKNMLSKIFPFGFLIVAKKDGMKRKP